MDMQVTAPPKREAGEFKTLPDGLYDMLIVGYEEDLKPEKFWKEEGKPEYQLKWELKVINNEEYNGTRVNYWTGNTIGRHPRNKLTNLLKVIDPEFDIDVAYKDEDEFKSRVRYKTARVVTNLGDPKVKKGDDGVEYTVQYPKVVSIMAPAEIPDSQTLEALIAEMGASIKSVDGEPF